MKKSITTVAKKAAATPAPRKTDMQAAVRRAVNSTDEVPSFSISAFENCKDKVPKQMSIDSSELEGMLSEHDVRDEKDGPAFSGAEFAPDTPRKNENVIQLNLAILDVDGGNVEAFKENCKAQGWKCIIYSTHSHTTSKPCFRAVFQPSRAIQPGEWKIVWDAMNYLLDANADKVTRDLSRMFYLPSHPKETAAEAFVEVINGDKPVDVDQLLMTPVIEEVVKKSRKKSSAGSSDELTCREIAEEVRASFAGGLWYYHENFRMYENGHWRKIDQRVEVTKAILESYAGLSAAGAYEVTETLKILCSQLGDEVNSVGDKAKLDVMRRLICLKNGTLDPVTRELLPHDPAHRRLCALDIDWNPSAKAKRFMAFLYEIWGAEDDYEKRVKTLQEFMGYTLLPSNKFERFLWLVGSGANGKSILLGVMAGLVGLLNTTWAHLDRLNKTAVRAALEGVMLNISTEMNAEGTMADGYLKSITSGEPVDAEPKYKDPYSFIPTVKLVAGTNHLPRLKDTSGGFARRAIILSCNKVFAPEERDANLAETLAGELDGILVWALEGLERLLERGRFVPPPSSDAMVQTYRTEADSVAMFNHECLDACDEGTPSGTLYAVYREFCTTNGFHPTNVAIFGRRLTEVGITTLRKSAGKPIRAAKFRTAAE